jgi:colanic acid/amylovoran biosynthesis glycosyltransferase
MKIAYILAQFPSVSETFIANEITELRNRGLDIFILAVNRPEQSAVQKALGRTFYVADICSGKAHLVALITSPRRYMLAAGKTVLCKGNKLQFLRNLKRFHSAVRFSCIIKQEKVEWLHAHFLSLPTDITIILSELCGLPFSCSAHAQDIYTADREVIRRKVAAAACVVTCTAFNKNYLTQLLSSGSKGDIRHIYHGIDLQQWNLSGDLTRAGNTRTEIRLLSVARLVEKKGLIFLLQAVKILLGTGKRVSCKIVGDGPLRQELETFIAANHLGGHICLAGALPADELADVYRQAHIFVLPCVVTGEGDRDGLPNVILEAIVSGLPVVTTPVSAIPELITHEVTGLLVAERDARAIADAVLQLAADEPFSRGLIRRGREKVYSDFTITGATDKLFHLFTHLPSGKHDES